MKGWTARASQRVALDAPSARIASGKRSKHQYASDFRTDECFYCRKEQLGKLGITPDNDYISPRKLTELYEPAHHHPQGIADAQNIVCLVPAYTGYANNMNSIPVLFLNSDFSFGVATVSVTCQDCHIPPTLGEFYGKIRIVPCTDDIIRMKKVVHNDYGRHLCTVHSACR